MSTDEWLDAVRHDQTHRDAARRQAEAIEARYRDARGRFMALMEESVRAEEQAAAHHAAFEVFRARARHFAEIMGSDEPDHDQITIDAGPDRPQLPDESTPRHP